MFQPIGYTDSRNNFSIAKTAFQVAGYLPVISSIVGLARIILGSVQIICGLSNNTDRALIKLGLKNILRGTVESFGFGIFFMPFDIANYLNTKKVTRVLYN